MSLPVAGVRERANHATSETVDAADEEAATEDFRIVQTPIRISRIIGGLERELFRATLTQPASCAQGSPSTRRRTTRSASMTWTDGRGIGCWHVCLPSSTKKMLPSRLDLEGDR